MWVRAQACLFQTSSHGQWHRGLRWYQSQFDPSARLRGESSPGYTDPRHPHAASRIRSVAPHALLHPDSDYVARSRYLERLRRFLDVFDTEQVLVVLQERLRRDPQPAFRRIFEHVGADPRYWDDDVAGLCELLGDGLPEWSDRCAPGVSVSR